MMKLYHCRITDKETGDITDINTNVPVEQVCQLLEPFLGTPTGHTAVRHGAFHGMVLLSLAADDNGDVWFGEVGGDEPQWVGKLSA